MRDAGAVPVAVVAGVLPAVGGHQQLDTLHHRYYRRTAVGQTPVPDRRRIFVRAAHRHHQQATVFPVARRARRPRRPAVAVFFPYHVGLGQRRPAVRVRRFPSRALAHTTVVVRLRRRPLAGVLVGPPRRFRLKSLRDDLHTNGLLLLN